MVLQHVPEVLLTDLNLQGLEIYVVSRVSTEGPYAFLIASTVANAISFTAISSPGVFTLGFCVAGSSFTDGHLLSSPC